MNGLVVFVEGSADGWYVLRALGKLGGADFDSRKPANLPTPFGISPGQGTQSHRGLILTWHARASLDELSLASSAEGHEPVFQAVAKLSANSTPPGDECLIFIVRMGGDRHSREVLKLVDDLKLAFGSGLTHDIERLALAFVFDTDTPAHFGQSEGDGVAARESWFKTEYQPLVGSSTAKHGVWQTATPCPWGLFVWHDEQTRCGTLEDLVEPELQRIGWNTRLENADQYLRTHAIPTDEVLTKPSSRSKARLTLAGQLCRPGDSLAQIIKRGDPKKPPAIPDEVFQTTVAQALVKFLTDIPWS